MVHKIIKTDDYLLVVDDEYIKDVRPFMGRWHLEDNQTLNKFPTYLTDLSACKLIIAHLPLNGSPILEGVDLLPPYFRHQEDDLDKKSFEFVRYIGGTEAQRLAYQDGYIDAREKYKYTEDDIRKAWNAAFTDALAIDEDTYEPLFFENFIKSLYQYPTEFECEMYNTEELKSLEIDWMKIGRPKTITTTQGIQWVGKYK